MMELERGEKFCSLTVAAVEELDRVSGRSATAAVSLFPELGDAISSSDAFLAAETACSGVYQSLEAQLASSLSGGGSAAASADATAALDGSDGTSRAGGGVALRVSVQLSLVTGTGWCLFGCLCRCLYGTGGQQLSECTGLISLCGAAGFGRAWSSESEFT